MEKSLSQIEWSLIQSFLAVAETGSLSAAARRLGASQPTLGRHIKALEDNLQVDLFNRHARGFELTGLGREMLAHARAMSDAMNALSLTAAGAQARLEGDVRITTSMFMAQHVMPGVISRIRRLEPDIRIDLVATDTTENLLFREADIAVRMYRPEQLDMVARHLGDISLGMFATRAYLERKGSPQNADELSNHDMVGYDTNDDILREMRRMGIPATRDWFAVRCDDQNVYWELVKAGCGLGFCQTKIARNSADLVEIPLDFPLPHLPVWLTAHEAVRQTPRVARVWDLLAEGLAPFVS